MEPGFSRIGMGSRQLRVVLHVGSSRLTLMDSFGTLPEGAEVLEATYAGFLLEQALGDATLRLHLAQCARVSSQPGAGTDSLVAWLRHGLERGTLVLVQQPVRRVVVPIEELPEEIPLGPADDPEDLEFDVVYPDGSPVQGLAYVLLDPGGSPSKGKLPADGVVAKKRADGTYTLSIVDVDVVVWSRPAVRVKQEVKLSARVSGIDDGTQGKVQIFRLYEEAPESAVATLSMTVQDGKAETTWKYVPASDAEQGTASFVAELSFEGGKVWRKSPPLDVELPQVASVTWSARAVEPGDAVELAVSAPGFDDGAGVEVTLMRLGPSGEETVGKLAPAKLAAKGARIPLTCGDATLPARWGDVYAKVTVKKDGIERAGTSPLLWVSAEAAAE